MGNRYLWFYIAKTQLVSANHNKIWKFVGVCPALAWNFSVRAQFSGIESTFRG